MPAMDNNTPEHLSQSESATTSESTAAPAEALSAVAAAQPEPHSDSAESPAAATVVAAAASIAPASEAAPAAAPARHEKRSHAPKEPSESESMDALLEQYAYDAMDTCAADGICSLLCPVGIDTGKLAARPGKPRGRVLCRPCLDWSERRPHLAGAVGAAICQHCFDQGLVRRVNGTRAVTITPKGQRVFREQFGAQLGAIQ